VQATAEGMRTSRASSGTRRAARAALGLVALLAACGRDQPAGNVMGAGRPAAELKRRAAAVAAAQRGLGVVDTTATTERQIVFGDLHVHTTYSLDAFLYALPLFGGEGAHPPADACDFARYCAGVDFFAITDHAESLTPERWRWTKESLRDCDARAGDPGNPDLVAFAGWEWTQVGATPETHYGHKNVIFPSLADDQLPARPITALSERVFAQAPHPWLLRGLQIGGALGGQPYADLFWLIGRLAELPNCPAGVDTRKLPPDCRENAPTPAELFEKLSQWGFDALVIPHGLSWGLHTPLDVRLDNQLDPAQHDPTRQRLLEVFSGHGSSEPYRAWTSVARDADGQPVCPPPRADFLPCCWQAGELMRARCGELSAAECEARVEQARRLALQADTAPHLVFPDTRAEDWLDCDQCRDCFKPAFALRPRASAQYSLAISAPAARDAAGRPLRFRWGFVASSDDHKAQPGTGYTQTNRRAFTDAHGLASGWPETLQRAAQRADPQQPQAVRRDAQSLLALLDVERVSSFMYPGGLVAAHAAGRSRAAIWQALERREVYGTSGPRILLWFDLVDAPQGRAPMGSEVEMAAPPRFVVRAAGDFVQLPGCPADSPQGLARERLAHLCHGQCYNPSDRRHPIAAIEVVRIRPQRTPHEDVGGLIEDPWLRHDCPADPAGCSFAFDDPEFATSGRDTVYYVRVLQETTPAINGANLRTEFDAAGNAVRVAPCSGSYRTPADDDCLAPVQERAWSSPIFVDQPRRG
jgi:Protein of unknown function (DUF3604)